MEGVGTAIPIVYPNNFKWNPSTEQLELCPGVERETMELLPEALDILKNIKEPIAVVCIAGPARSGKSYILSKLQDGVQFELGHTMTSHTTGIWMAKSPKLCTTSDGQEVRLILLDTEGIGAASAEDDGMNDRFDNQIFTLSALISSLLIYNSQGVPRANDLEKLQFIAKLSESIHTDSNNISIFRDYSPDFLWLVRDILLSPTDNEGKKCDIKTHLCHKVLQEEDNCSVSGVRNKKNTIRKYIRETFSSFDAFGLPVPAMDPEVVENMNDQRYKYAINPDFHQAVDTFIDLVHRKLKPKRVEGTSSMNGEQFCVILVSFIKALNETGNVPEWFSAWSQAVKLTGEQALDHAIHAYRETISSLYNVIPTSVPYIIGKHMEALETAKTLFMAETNMITDVQLSEEYLTKLEETCAKFDQLDSTRCYGGILFELLIENDRVENDRLQQQRENVSFLSASACASAGVLGVATGIIAGPVAGATVAIATGAYYVSKWLLK